jgi:hypothetical protein
MEIQWHGENFGEQAWSDVDKENQAFGNVEANEVQGG